MTSRLLPLVPMIALLVVAAVQDLRCRKIRNWLTLALAASGVLASVCATSGMPLSQSMLGLLVGFAIPFVLFALGALGGGDVKLLAGIGAWVGPGMVVEIFLVSAIVGLLIVLVQCTAQGRLFTLFRNSAILAISLVHVDQLGLRHATETGKSCRSVDRPLPYAVPVLAATLIALLVLT